MPLGVHAVDHLVLNVSDVVSAAWYGRRLGPITPISVR
jgi:hypothetical protein